MSELIYIPTNNAEGLPLLHVFATRISCLCVSSYSDRCEALSHCGFNFNSLMISDEENPFMGLLAI